jgi:hypothetical protein
VALALPRGNAAAQAPASGPGAPSLVVLVAVDQMRADYLGRYAGQWVGGFLRFYRDATLFEHGRQEHASTETAPGHSTMLSGREPAHTGIPLNSQGVQDPAAPLIGADGPGASPRAFQGTTLYDWMLAQDSATTALSVSRKDRGAILPIGRARGVVLWFAGGQFTTSRYYADTLPTWVAAFNARGGVARLAGTTWDLLRPDSAYGEPDSMPFENGGRDFVFPHRLPASPDSVARRIPGYPWMDSLTLSLALEGAAQLHLGRRSRPDLLAISLSTTDAVGHAFGPDSREIHDQLLRVDWWLGQFMDSLARLVPGGQILYVLTGDHGISSLPEYQVLVRHRPAGRISLAGLASSLEARLESRYRMDFGLTFNNGIVTADVEALRARAVDVDSLSAALADEARHLPGVAVVFTPSTLAAAPDSSAAHLWRRLLPPGFGWLICASTNPGYIWSNGALGGEHGAANPEDIEVPIAFLGPRIRAQRLERPVRTVDIAPTLARLLMVRPTEPLDGMALPEVVSP